MEKEKFYFFLGFVIGAVGHCMATIGLTDGLTQHGGWRTTVASILAILWSIAATAIGAGGWSVVGDSDQFEDGLFSIAWALFMLIATIIDFFITGGLLSIGYRGIF